MSQHDMNIDDGPGATVRADINSALQALASNSKGPTAPSTPYAGQLWLEDDNPSGTVWTLWQYDGADWIKLGEVNSTTNTFNAVKNPGGVLAFRITAGATIAANSTIHLSSSGSESNEGNATIRIPFACTARNLYVSAGGSPGAGKTFIFTARKNAADSALTATISDGNTTAADTSNTVTFAAGDTINVKVVSASGSNVVGGISASIELF